MAVTTGDADPAPPDTRSHTQLRDYLECPRLFELSRVRRIPRRPGAWFPGGTAVHAAIERYLRAQLAEERGES